MSHRQPTDITEDEVADTLAARGTAERRWSILEQVRRDGQATVTDLSRSFGVSEVSIRRDLERLEEMGYLRRVHGGAQALATREPGAIIDARQRQNVAVKQALGRAGAGLIQPGQTILIDAGTTMLELARAIPRPLLQEGGLTIVTRSLLIASELRVHRRTRLLILGGIYQHDYDSCIGAGLEQALGGLHVHTLFVGSDAVTAERGISTDNVLEAPLYQHLRACAERVVAIADSSKIGIHRLQVTLPFEQIHTFITDGAAPPDFVARARACGTEVILVPVPRP